MPDTPNNSPSLIPPAEKQLLSGAERRMDRAMWVLGMMGTILCWLWRDGGWSLGFAIGAVLSALNFHWMKTGIHALSDVATALPEDQSASGTPEPGRRGVWVRFVLRYALIGVAGYAIFKSSFVSLSGFLLGLFVFIAAILAEIAYQIYRAFRTG